MVAFRIVMILYIGILAFLIGGFICSKLFKKRLQKCPYITWLRYRVDIRVLFTILLVVTVLCIFVLGSIYTNTASPSLPDNTSDSTSQAQSAVSATQQQSGFLNRIADGVSKILNILDGDFSGFVDLFTAHKWFPTFLCFSLPILTISALILTILDFFPLRFKKREEFLIFSHTDDRSLLLAENMMKQNPEEETDSSWQLRKDRKVIFLHTDKSKLSAEEQEKVNQVRGRIYPYSEVDLLRIHRGLRKRTLRFFFLSKDSDESFSRLKELIDGVAEFHLFRASKRNYEALEAREARGIYQQELYFLSESDSSSLLVDHLRSKMSDGKVRKPVFAHTEIHLLDRYRLVTYDLLREHPLYNHSTENKESKEINILIIGFGKVGQSFYKTANAFSHIKNHTVSFTILDNKIHKHLGELLAQTPEIQEDGKPVTRNVNAESKALISKITDLSKDTPFTYIMLSVGDDDRNIRIARTLVRYYRKARWEKTVPCLPAIFVNLENAIKSQYVNDIFKLEGDPKDLTSLSPVAIGGDRTTFSEKLLLNRKVWEMAIKLHDKMNSITEENNKSSNPSADDTKCENSTMALKPFMTEYERRSSIAAVSYAKYHIYANSLTPEDEHNRWMRYSRSEGMRNIGPEAAKEIIEASHTHRDIVAGLTPCLVSNTRLKGIHNDLDRKHRAVVKKPLDSFSEKDSLVVKVAPKLAKFYDHPSGPLDL